MKALSSCWLLPYKRRVPTPLSWIHAEGITICGLTGAIGTNWNQGTLRALVLCNRDRGTDSLGFFDSSGRMIKAADDPADVLQRKNITNWLNNSQRGTKRRKPSWFVAGHTRLATRGSVNRQNSHPFRYGKIIGSHNGMITAPKGYVVDSQYLFDSLNKAGGDYNEAWCNISGYWGITWFDGESFYMQVHNGDLHLAQVDGVYYYSSDDEHLKTAVGYTPSLYKIKEGETWKFTLTDEGVQAEKVEEFVSTAPDYWANRYGVSNTNDDTDWTRVGMGATNYGYAASYTPSKGRRHGRSGKGVIYETATPVLDEPEDVREWEAEWQTAWNDYTDESS